MATTLKVLGQSAPSATTETTLYTVPAATSTVASSLVICNRGAVADAFRVSVSVAGGATATKDYLFYDLPIDANDTFIATIGIALAATDVVRVYAGTTSLSFNLFGQENT